MNAAPAFEILRETDALQRVESPQALATLALERGRGAWTVAEPAGSVSLDATIARAVARSGGLVRPDPQLGWWSSEVQVCRAQAARYLPQYGIVTDACGAAFAGPIGGLVAAPAPLAEAHAKARAPAQAWRRPATVFMPWGARFNYGHFLLDALPSLLAVEQAGLLGRAPPVAPRLKAWQRELLAMVLPLGAKVQETRAEVLAIPEAVFATSMNHFLHTPNALLTAVRERVLSAAPSPRRRAAVGRRIYLSRRSHALPMRVMINEDHVERALAARGFVIVRPERLRPQAQIALMRDAEVIVGASGAAMANALFAPPGALLVEIQPQVFTSTWLAAMADIVGLDWRIYYTPAPAAVERVSPLRRARRGFRFGFELPLDDALAFVDAELARRG